MSSITKDAYEGDIVSRLRNWRGLHLAHSGELFEEAATEIEVQRSCSSAARDEITRLRLTRGERRALEFAIGVYPLDDSIPDTLRALLERL